jgi:hypothetical protein
MPLQFQFHVLFKLYSFEPKKWQGLSSEFEVLSMVNMRYRLLGYDVIVQQMAVALFMAEIDLLSRFGHNIFKNVDTCLVNYTASHPRR